MDVAFVHPDVPGADGTGATHSATIIVRSLAGRGHDVTVFARGSADADSRNGRVEPGDRGATDGCDGGSDAGPFAAAGDGTAGDVAVRPLNVAAESRHTATGLNHRLRTRLRAGEFDGFDVVHSYLPSSIPAVGTIATETAARTVVTLNAYGGVCPKNDLRYMDRERCRERGLFRCTACSLATSRGHDAFGPLYRTASRLGNLRVVRAGLDHLDSIDVFQALSPAVRAAYAAFAYPTDRITVVPTPLDPRFLVDHGSSFEPPYDLLYVGAIERHKGVERLIPMLAAVREAGIDARLTVVGEGGRRSAIEGQVSDRGLEEYVELVGHRPYAALPDVYASHDLFVYPGVWDEPFGRVFLEALAAGTPVVGTDVGAVEWIVGDGGLTTDATAQSLATGVITAITDRGLSAFSERSRDHLDRYRADRVVGALESLYRDGSVSGDLRWRA